jgi:hypothetical protein
MRYMASLICRLEVLLERLCDRHALKGIRYYQYEYGTALVLVVPVALCSSLVWKGGLDGGGW